MSRELLLSEREVHEYLGVKVAPREHGVNITCLNALGDRWLRREDLLTWLVTNAESLDSKTLRRLHGELEEITRSK